MRRRCMPTEWPAHSVTPQVATNSARAPQVKKTGPSTRAAAVIDPIQSDLAGAQRTVPRTGSDEAVAKTRSDPGTSSMASLLFVPRGALAAVAQRRALA